MSNKIDTFTKKDVDDQLFQYIASKRKFVTLKEIPSSIQSINSCFINEIKDPRIHSTLNCNQYFYIWPPCKQILLLYALSDSIIKFMKLLYNVPEASTNWFNIYHLHYKE